MVAKKGAPGKRIVPVVQWIERLVADQVVVSSSLTRDTSSKKSLHFLPFYIFVRKTLVEEIIGMFKEMISPTQEWLLFEGRCIGCGAPLKEARMMKRIGKTVVVVCSQCGRNFIYDDKTKKYRRAPFKWPEKCVY